MHAADEPSALARELDAAPPERPPGALLPEDDELLRAFLREDVGVGDVTGETLLEPGLAARGRLRAKAPGVVCGLEPFARVFALLDPRARARFLARDGDEVRPGTALCEVEAGARALLAGERTALNLVQRLSGVASLTRRFVDAARRGGGAARIYDTRKTTPGLRRLEKHAVRCGGGQNHRFGLHDEAMVKNNHVDVTGRGPGALVRELRLRRGAALVIHAEARDEREALEAAAAGADVVLLDNMDVAAMRALCPRLRAQAASAGRTIAIEASGGVTLETVGAIAACGVDRVSVGALTHSAPALDLSLAIERAG